MPDDNVVFWPGLLGNKYQYWSYGMGHSLKAEAGNYIFARINNNNQWEPVYIGETEDLNDRVTNHEKRECAIRHRATHIHAHLISGRRQVRLDEETDLRNNFSTLCNDQ